MNFHIIRQRHHSFSTDLSIVSVDRLGAKCEVDPASKTTGDRRNDQVTLDEVERIVL